MPLTRSRRMAPEIPTAPLPTAALDAAPDLLIVVQRDWNGWQKAMVPLSALEDVHWRQPAGAPRPLIHGYVPCAALVSGHLPHDCTGSGEPHRLLVCLLKCHAAEVVYQRLADQASSRR